MCTDEAEARISRMISKEQQQGAAVTAAAPSPPMHAAAPWPAGAEYPGPTTLFHCPLPSFASPGADADPPTSRPPAYPSSRASFPPQNPSSPESLNNDFLNSLQPSTSPRGAAMETNGGTIHFSREDDGRNHRTDFTDVDISSTLGFAAFGAESDHHHHRQQQHNSQEGYASMSAASTTNGNTIASLSSATLHDPTAAAGATITPPETTPPVTKSADDINPQRMASLLAAFSSSVFQSQAEIAGISSAVAEYIAWMRKVPTGIAPPNTSLVYVNVLEAVENRLREMREIAETRPRAAFRDMVAALQSLGPTGVSMCDALAHLEDDFERQSADVTNFFQTRYNACAALSEQTHSVARTTSSSNKERA